MFVTATVLTLLCLILLFGHEWLIENIGLISVDEVIFHLKVPLSGTSGDMISSVIWQVVVRPVVLTALLMLALYFIPKLLPLQDLKFTLFNKERRLSLRKLIWALAAILATFGVLNQLHQFNEDYHIADYIASQSESSTFIGDNYVDPAKVELTFPDQKRNLIYIYLESTEATYLSEANGGLQSKSLMPEIEKLALENTNFSNTAKLGGALQATATNWTMAGLVAQTAGIPLKLPVALDQNYGTETESLLNGAYSLGQILQKEGYTQVFMAGSDMTFGGRRVYFKAHGDYDIKDVYQAKRDGIISEDYWTYWGFEDSILYSYAKQELTELAKSSQPFNFSMLTINTHFPDGYIEDSCKDTHEEDYTKSIVCSSTMLAEFIKWIQAQDFYENTTVILSGDHLSMASSEVFGEEDNPYLRTTLNVFINSAVSDVAEETTKNRIFTTMDMFPTTLAALGVQIQGDRLALGTNLYSGTKTLAEEYGIDTMNEEIEKRSDFYLFKFF